MAEKLKGRKIRDTCIAIGDGWKESQADNESLSTVAWPGGQSRRPGVSPLVPLSPAPLTLAWPTLLHLLLFAFSFLNGVTKPASRTTKRIK